MKLKNITFILTLIIIAISIFVPGSLLFKYKIPVGVGELIILDVIMGAALAVECLRIAAFKDRALRSSNMDILISVVLLYAVISLGVAHANGIPLRQSLADLRNVFYVVAVYFLIRRTAQDENKEKTYINAITFVTVVQAVSVILLYVMRIAGKNMESVFIRVFSETVFLQTFLIVYLAYKMFFVRIDKRQFILVLPLVVAVIISFSRAYWLAMAFVFLVYAGLLLKKNLKRVLKLSVIVLPVIVMAVLCISISGVGGTISGRLKSIGDNRKDPSVEYRYEEKAAVVSSLKGKWLMGWGLGKTIRAPQVEGSSIEQGEWRYIHNSYLWILYKLGCIGLLLYAGIFLGLMAIESKRPSPLTQEKYNKDLLRALKIYALSILFLSAIHPILVSELSAIYLGALLGLVQS